MARPVGSKSTVPSKADLKHTNRVMMLQTASLYKELGEEWKWILLNEKPIQISNYGRLRTDLYNYVTPEMTKEHVFMYDSVPLANLVAETFLGVERDAIVKFKDFDTHNCSVSNLEVVNG